MAIDRRELLGVMNLPADAPLFDVLYTDRQFRAGELPSAIPYDPLRRMPCWTKPDGTTPTVTESAIAMVVP